MTRLQLFNRFGLNRPAKATSQVSGQIWAAALSLSILAGCGGGGAGGVGTDVSAPQTGINANVKALSDYMNDWYLWYAEMPTNVQLASFNNTKDALEALKVKPKDRFSYIDTAANANRFFVEGKAIGAGFGMVERDGGVLISYVRPGSPAEAAGLRRGDRIKTANGVTATTLDSIDSAIGPREVGFQLTLVVNREGQELTIPMTKAEYDILTVTNSNLLVQDGRRIGYLYFFAFIQRTTSDWQTAISALRAQGAQDLIVDMRHNGGGYLNTAGEIAGSMRLGIPSGAEVLTQLRFNNRHSSNNTLTRIAADSATPRFGKVIFLISEGSCSATEALINGLAPFQQIITIGTKTCGKPVGFNPRTVGDEVFSIVTFDMSNSQGNANYYDGLSPNCNVTDTFTGQFGTLSEPLTAAAMGYLRSGTCPATAIGSNEKSMENRKAGFRTNFGVDGQWSLH